MVHIDYVMGVRLASMVHAKWTGGLEQGEKTWADPPFPKWFVLAPLEIRRVYMVLISYPKRDLK